MSVVRLASLPRSLTLCLLLAVGVEAQPVRLDAPPPTAPVAPVSDTGFYVEPVTPPGSIFDAVDVEVASDGRIFVLMKGGRLRVILPDGTLLDEPFVDVGGEVLNAAERGLLGFALHPDFPSTPHVYLVYTVDDGPLPRPENFTRGYGRVTRFTVSAADPNRADPASRRVLIGENFHDGIPSCYLFHSIGTIAFGNDGSLFVGAGDGDGAPVEIDTGGQYDACFSDDPTAGVHPSQDIGSFRAQSLESLAGKILRIDPETGLGLPDNPFYTGDPDDTASRVWALGLRNPFRFSVAPPKPGETGPGDVLIGDVGQSKWEELNRARGGENFGWPCFEGPEPYPPAQTVTGPLACSTPRAGTLTVPYAQWHHDDPDRSLPAGDIAYSITGGEVYQGTAYPEAYQGALFFADYARQWVRAGRLGEDGLEAVTLVGEGFGFLVDLAVEPSTGEILAADVINNHVVRIRYAGAGGSPPVARIAASTLTGAAPAEIAFSAAASVDPDGTALTYEWTFGDGAGAEGAEVSHTYTEVGRYPVTVRVVDADGAESRASLSVRIGRSAPVVAVESPTSYVVPASGRVTLRASATDEVDPFETFAYTWSVDLVHNDHVHERVFFAETPEASFVLAPHATEGETSHYRATVAVTDSEGIVTHETRTLREYDADEVDVAPAGLARGEGVAEVSLPRSVRVGRVGIPGLSEAPDGLTVEVRDDGAWRPVRFPSVLVEADTLQVVFVEAETDAIRVTGADTLAAYARVRGEGIDGVGDGADVGAPARPGRTGTDRGATVMVGGGAVEAGAFHLVQGVMAGDGAVTARLDAVAGDRPTAGAGVAVRAGLGANDPGVAFLAESDGDLVLWTQSAAGVLDSTAVGQWNAPVWLRISRDGLRVSAQTSADGATWTTVGGRLLELPTNLFAGPAVAGGDTEGTGATAVGWLGAVSVENTTGTPPVASGAFEIVTVAPNPSRVSADLVVAAGLAGSYRLDVVDALGRVVWAGPPRSVSEPAQLLLTARVSGLAPGVYMARVRHAESGAVVSRPISVVR